MEQNEISSANKKVVTPLRRMLCNLGLQEMVNYLQEWGIPFNIYKDTGGYSCGLRPNGSFKYRGHDSKSARAATADALASFLTHEERDYHEV